MKMVVRFWKMAALMSGWPLISRSRSFPYFFVVYPGSPEDIEEYFPAWIIRAARNLLPPIFPIGRLGDGLVLATFSSTAEMEASPELASTVLEHILRAADVNQTPAVAMAGRMPGILFRHGQTLQHPIVPGDKGTVHAVTQSVLAASDRHQLPLSSPIAVIGAKGFIGKRLIEHLRHVGCSNLIAVDHRYGERKEENGVIYTSEAQDLKRGEIVVVLTAEGVQIAPQVPHLDGKIIIDDTHPQLPHWLVSQLQTNGCTTYKMALELDGVTFDPPLPGYRRTWIPGCVWEAAVVSHILRSGGSLPQSQEEFDHAARELPFHIVLQPHFDNVRRRQW
jgi:hypothetical protein